MSGIDLKQQQTEHKGIRDAFLGLSVSQQPDKCSFVLNPPSDEVDLFLRKSGSTRTPMRLSPDPSGMINLNALENGTFDVEVFAKSTSPPLLLHKFAIDRNGTGVSVHSIGLNATAVESIFTKADLAFGGAAVLGQFTDREGKSCNIEGKTDVEGRFRIVLPKGTIKNLLAKSKEGIEVPKRGVIVIPDAPAGTGPRRPLSITIDVESRSFGSALRASSANAKVVVLGDVSGSMSSGKIDVLKKSFQEMLVFCEGKNNSPIALASWNSWVDWCEESYITTSIKRDNARSWIASRNAVGGNDMRYAIEECMRKFTDVDDVYVICDGDLSPFNPSGGHGNVLTDVPRPSSIGNESKQTSYNDSSWKLFRNRFPLVCFHFVALGSGASTQMQEMAAIGNGSYKETS